MQQLVDKLKKIVGAGAWEDDDTELQPNLTEWRQVVRGKTPILLWPQSREQVADIVRTCNDAGVGVVPQGGNTGMCAGAVPDDSGQQILLNLSRLKKIRSVDPVDFSLVAEAGCVLATLQAAARDVDRLFPLSLGGEGSCQIGGNLSTNAGGINVLRYGTARDLVLGVEVVLADGTIWDGIKTLRKDTAGYDLKQLFIGSEGTLGVITAVALKLFPLPGEPTTALIALSDAADAVTLLSTCRTVLGDDVLAFELISAAALDCVLRHIPNTESPFAQEHPWYVLVDAVGDVPKALLAADEQGLVADAIVAKNASEAERLWRMRHAISEAQKRDGPGAKHDVSVPIGRIREFLSAGEARLSKAVPLVSPLVFGHVGDGNLHYNMQFPAGMTPEAIAESQPIVSRIVYDLVTEMGGSISAEHGIGVTKKAYLEEYKSDAELGLMRSLKAALDPRNTLNPGKVI